MSDSSTLTVSETPERLRRSARGFLIGSIVMWAVFLLVVLGSIAGATMSSSSGDDEVNVPFIIGRIIGLVITVGLPLALAILFTVRSSALSKRAAALELRDASSY